MKFFEYQSKHIFSRYGIPIPRGRLALNAVLADHIHEELKSDVVIKAQVLAGGRGKAGGVRLAKTAEQVEEIATEILGLTIQGMPVRKILVEEAIKIQQEFFVSIFLDKDNGVPLLLASKYGGVDIESAAGEEREGFFRIPIDPLLGLQVFQVRSAALAIEIPKHLWGEFSRILLCLWRIFVEIDAENVEVNPLVLSEGDRLVALDAKISVDDNAFYRHPELTEFYDLEVEDRLEYQAKKYGLSYVKLPGNIGCMVNGAGLAMATLDLLQENGGKAANFLDIGGGANAEKVASGLRIVLDDRRVKVILVNIFGGITRCDEVARGLLEVLSEKAVEIPLVIRLTGTNAAEGLELLQEKGIKAVDSIQAAVKEAVRSSKGKRA